jgi:5-methylcytosine-specific restriction endonuclease McrA
MTMKGSKKNWKQFGNKEDSNKYECFYCGDRLSDFNRTVDHIVPKSQGGILSNDNKVYACKRCNQFKADTDVETFLGMTKFLIREMNQAHEDKMSYYVRLQSRLQRMIKSNAKDKEGTKHTP